MQSTDTLVVRAGRPSRGGRRAVLIGVGLLAIVAPVALLGVAGIALRRSAALPSAPQGAVRFAAPGPEVQVLSTPDSFASVLEHYTGAPGGAMTITSSSTRLPLVGQMDQITIAPLEAGQVRRSGLVVSAGPDLVNWVLLFGTQNGSGTWIVSGRSAAGTRGELTQDEFEEWMDARLHDRGSAGTESVKGTFYRTPLSFKKLWRVYARMSGLPETFTPGQTSGGVAGKIPSGDLAAPHYWTGVTGDGTRIGVIERRRKDRIVLLAVMGVPGKAGAEALIAVARH